MLVSGCGTLGRRTSGGLRCRYIPLVLRRDLWDVCCGATGLSHACLGLHWALTWLVLGRSRYHVFVMFTGFFLFHIRLVLRPSHLCGTDLEVDGAFGAWHFAHCCLFFLSGPLAWLRSWQRRVVLHSYAWRVHGLVLAYTLDTDTSNSVYLRSAWLRMTRIL